MIFWPAGKVSEIEDLKRLFQKDDCRNMLLLCDCQNSWFSVLCNLDDEIWWFDLPEKSRRYQKGKNYYRKWSIFCLSAMNEWMCSSVNYSLKLVLKEKVWRTHADWLTDLLYYIYCWKSHRSKISTWKWYLFIYFFLLICH